MKEILLTLYVFIGWPLAIGYFINEIKNTFF